MVHVVLCEGCVEDSLQPALLEFICTTEVGVDIKSKRFDASKTDLTMAQFKCCARYREGAKTCRHLALLMLNKLRCHAHF